jgi:hypothetical protein
MTELGQANRIRPAPACPYCRAVNDATSGVGTDRKPTVGEYAVCIYCGGVAIFGIGYVLSRCPDGIWQAEREPLRGNIRAAVWAVHAMHSAGRRQ